MYQLGWFSTGRDKAARDLLTVAVDSIKRGELKAKILFVFCNRGPSEAEETAEFFKLVGSYHLHLIYFSSRDFISPGGYKRYSLEWHLEYDREVTKRLAGLNFDLGVLAGYMLIVGKEMCQKYKMINLHPAAPGGPAGSWERVIDRLIAKRAEYSGVMMHLVTPELDKGPPVTYCTFPIKDKSNLALWEGVKQRKKNSKRNLISEIRYRRGLPREFPLIVATLKVFSQDKVRVEGDKIVNAQGEVINGYDLTKEIDAAIKGKI